MVQNIENSKQQNYTSINKIGVKDNGRILYQVTDANGKIAGAMSIAPKDADIFEKSYTDILNNTAKLQKYYETTPPEKIEKKKKIGKWIAGISTAILGGIPLIKAKGKTWQQVGLTAAGSLVGFGIGSYLNVKLTTPPGAIELARTTQKISKLDIQPETEL